MNNPTPKYDADYLRAHLTEALSWTWNPETQSFSQEGGDANATDH